jgi:hypothetical protein
VCHKARRDILNLAPIFMVQELSCPTRLNKPLPNFGDLISWAPRLKMNNKSITYSEVFNFIVSISFCRCK